MKMFTSLLLFPCLSLVLFGCSQFQSSEKTQGTDPLHWGYQGVENPDHWALLSPSFKVCETGREQSPINIVMPLPGFGQEKLEFHYRPTPLTIRNNGHTIQVNYQGGSFLRMNDRVYKLRQFHFHDPSEHHIDGKIYPMEMHMVHQDDGGHVLVVGILLEFGRENTVFSRVGDLLERQNGSRIPATGEEVITGLTFNLMDVLPADTHHFSYHGSLTTPPCTEGVQWIIIRTPIEISELQAGRFVSAFGPNARPLQPLQDRSIQEH